MKFCLKAHKIKHFTHNQIYVLEMDAYQFGTLEKAGLKLGK